MPLQRLRPCVSEALGYYPSNNRTQASAAASDWPSADATPSRGVSPYGGFGMGFDRAPGLYEFFTTGGTYAAWLAPIKRTTSFYAYATFVSTFSGGSPYPTFDANNTPFALGTMYKFACSDTLDRYAESETVVQVAGVPNTGSGTPGYPNGFSPFPYITLVDWSFD